MATAGLDQGADEVQLSAETDSVVMKREKGERALGGAEQGVKAAARAKHSPYDQIRAPWYSWADEREQNCEREQTSTFSHSFGFSPATLEASQAVRLESRSQFKCTCSLLRFSTGSRAR